MEKNNTIGGCSKHKGQSFINCPICATESKENPKTLHEFMEQFKVTESEAEDLLYFSAILKARKLGISPLNLFMMISNYNKLQEIFK